MLALLLQTAYQDLLILKQSAVSINCGGKEELIQYFLSENVNLFYLLGKAVPFRLEFISDAYEISKASTEGVAAITTDGAKVQFFQTSC